MKYYPDSSFIFSILLISVLWLTADQVNAQEKAPKRTLFETLYQSEGRPSFEIVTDSKQLLRHSDEEEYQEAQVKIQDENGATILELPGRVRTRGNMRKQVCRFPPIKMDFKKTALKELGFKKQDRLKLVFPCGSRDFEQQKLFKEYFTYQLFDLVDTIGMQTKLVDIRIGGVDSESFEFVGMLVEEEKHYTKRYDAELVPSERSLSWPAFDREHFVKMQFFQYMIANTDWAVVTKHNLEMVKFPNNLRVVAVPYDFDYAGVVGQHYARPAENLPITSVRDRYFVPYPVQEDEFDKMVEFYLDLEDEIYALCDSAIYMTQKSIDENKKFISKFFDILRKPQKFKPEVVKNIE